jgi:hypothetical protein
MAHYRTLLGAAVGLNTAITVGEAVAGWQAQSLGLLMESMHNLSDALALVFLFLAFLLPTALSRTSLRSANVLHALGSRRSRRDAVPVFSFVRARSASSLRLSRTAQDSLPRFAQRERAPAAADGEGPEAESAVSSSAFSGCTIARQRGIPAWG